MLASASSTQNVPVADVLQSAAGTSSNADASGSAEPAKRAKKVSYCLLNLNIQYLVNDILRSRRFSSGPKSSKRLEKRRQLCGLEELSSQWPLLTMMTSEVFSIT